MLFEPLAHLRPQFFVRSFADTQSHMTCWKFHGLFVSACILISVYGLFEWSIEEGSTIEESRTIAVNTIVMIEIFYLFNCRSLTKSVFRMGFFSNKLIFLGVIVMILLQIAFTYTPIMNDIFQSKSIGI